MRVSTPSGTSPLPLAIHRVCGSKIENTFSFCGITSPWSRRRLTWSICRLACAGQLSIKHSFNAPAPAAAEAEKVSAVFATRRRQNRSIHVRFQGRSGGKFSPCFLFPTAFAHFLHRSSFGSGGRGSSCGPPNRPLRSAARPCGRGRGVFFPAAPFAQQLVR